MSDYADFEEEEARLFAGDVLDEKSPSKGMRLIPSWLSADFMAWLQDYHPERVQLAMPGIKLLLRHFDASGWRKSL